MLLQRYTSAGNSTTGVTFEQTKDITLTGKTESIAKYSVAFYGTYNGNGKTICGLDYDESYETGLFGRCENATIQNIILISPSIKSTGIAGGIAGYCRNCTVENCAVIGGSVSGDVSGNTCGGIVGIASGGTIKNCYSSAGVNNGIYCGGIVGDISNNVTVSGCYNEGLVTGTISGAIVGQVTDDTNTINNCWTKKDTNAIFAGGTAENWVDEDTDKEVVKNDLNLAATDEPWMQRDGKVILKNTQSLRPVINGVSISLDESFSVNVTTDDAQYEAGGFFDVYTLSLEYKNENNVFVSFSDSYTEDEKTGDYKFSGVKAFSAKNLGDTLTVRLKMTKDYSETIIYSEEKDFTVRDYLMTLIKGKYPTNIKALAADILNYGAAAQQYFLEIDESSETLVNYELDICLNVTPDVIDSVKENINPPPKTISLDTLPYKGTSLLLRDKVRIRHYVEASDLIAFSDNIKEIDNVSCAYFEEAVTPLQFDENLTTELDGTGGNYIKYSVNNYILQTLNTSSDNLMVALYYYGVAAEKRASDTYNITETSDAGDIKSNVTTSDISDAEAKAAIENGNVLDANLDQYFFYSYDDDNDKYYCYYSAMESDEIGESSEQNPDDIEF